MEVLTVSGAALLTVICFAVVGKCNIQMGKFICIGGAVVIIGAMLLRIQPLIVYIKDMAGTASVTHYLSYIFKTVAIVYSAEFASEICTEAGCQMLAKSIIAFSKAEILVICLPLFREIVDFAVSLCS